MEREEHPTMPLLLSLSLDRANSWVGLEVVRLATMGLQCLDAISSVNR
jgi:hypothetical protein